MPLAVMHQPFDHPDWIWEIKYDGFRALACMESGESRLVSRKGIVYKSFRNLTAAIGRLYDHDVILDGEIVCLDSAGCPQFNELLWRPR